MDRAIWLRTGIRGGLRWRTFALYDNLSKPHFNVMFVAEGVKLSAELGCSHKVPYYAPLLEALSGPETINGVR